MGEEELCGVGFATFNDRTYTCDREKHQGDRHSSEALLRDVRLLNHDLPIEQVLDVWSELDDAFYGKNSFGGDTAEIYLYRLASVQAISFLSADPKVRRDARIALVNLALRFEASRNVQIMINDHRFGRWFVDTDDTHRVHLRVAREPKEPYWTLLLRDRDQLEVEHHEPAVHLLIRAGEPGKKNHVRCTFVLSRDEADSLARRLSGNSDNTLNDLRRAIGALRDIERVNVSAVLAAIEEREK